MQLKSRRVSTCLRAAAWVTGSLLLVASLPGQAPDDEVRITRQPYVPRATAALYAETDLVPVRTVVRDRNRQVVTGLRQGDFQVLDNGKPQAISAFLVEKRPSPKPGSADAPPAEAFATKPIAPSARPVAARPRFIALYFDDHNMPPGDIEAARIATEKFVREGLLPGDRVGVFTSSSFVRLDFTGEPEKLLAALSRLKTQQRRADETANMCPRLSLYHAYLITVARDRQALELAIQEGVGNGCLLVPRPQQETMVHLKAERMWAVAEMFALNTYDSIEIIVQRMGRLEGIRTLLLASSGFLTLSQPVLRRQDALIETALRSGVVINALDAKGVVAEWQSGAPSDFSPRRLRARAGLGSVARTIEFGDQGAVNDPMEMLSGDTGGRFFTNSNDLTSGIHELADVPEVSYVLGFAPQAFRADGRFHKLEVKLIGQSTPGLTVEARRGYYAPTKGDLEPKNHADRLDEAVLATNNVAEIPCQVGVTVEKPEGRETMLRVVIRVEARNLPFEKRGDRSVERLRVVTALFDAQENFVAGSEAQVDLSLREATLERIQKEGLEGEMELRVPPGSYRLRQVVQETVQGRMAAMNRMVEVRE